MDSINYEGQILFNILVKINRSSQGQEFRSLVFELWPINCKKHFFNVECRTCHARSLGKNEVSSAIVEMLYCICWNINYKILFSFYFFWQFFCASNLFLGTNILFSNSLFVIVTNNMLWIYSIPLHQQINIPNPDV